MLEAEVERLLWSIDATRAVEARDKVFRGATSGPALKETGNGASSERKGNSETKALMPPLRSAKKLTAPTPINRATGTHGKHWRG